VSVFLQSPNRTRPSRGCEPPGGAVVELKTRTNLGQDGRQNKKDLTHLLTNKDLMNASRNETERGGVESAQIHNLLLNLYLHLKAGDFKDLARLVDVLKLHGFLPSFDAR
jgi:hypothetical protein